MKDLGSYKVRKDLFEACFASIWRNEYETTCKRILATPLGPTFTLECSTTPNLHDRNRMQELSYYIQLSNGHPFWNEQIGVSGCVGWGALCVASLA